MATCDVDRTIIDRTIREYMERTDFNISPEFTGLEDSEDMIILPRVARAIIDGELLFDGRAFSNLDTGSREYTMASYFVFGVTN